MTWRHMTSSAQLNSLPLATIIPDADVMNAGSVAADQIEQSVIKQFSLSAEMK